MQHWSIHNNLESFIYFIQSLSKGSLNVSAMSTASNVSDVSIHSNPTECCYVERYVTYIFISQFDDSTQRNAKNYHNNSIVFDLRYL